MGTNENETAVTLSLGEGATYEIYHEMFNILAGQLPWQNGTGWNIALNGEDVQVLRVDDEGLTVRPMLDETGERFGAPRFVGWEAVATVQIY